MHRIAAGLFRAFRANHFCGAGAALTIAASTIGAQRPELTVQQSG